MTIEFRTIDRFSGYRFGSDGSVWSCWKRFAVEKGFPVLKKQTCDWTKLKPSSNQKGYPIIRLCENGGRAGRQSLVHRLILEAFQGPCPRGFEACHNDGNPANAAIENLRWDSRSSNFLDKRIHGTAMAGKDHPRPARKYSESLIVEIRRLAGSGVKQRTIAKKTGVPIPTVNSIVKRKTWSWL